MQGPELVLTFSLSLSPSCLGFRVFMYSTGYMPWNFLPGNSLNLIASSSIYLLQNTADPLYLNRLLTVPLSGKN